MAPHKILILYGSYRTDRVGIRLANYIVAGLKDRGHTPELIDAKVVNLPLIDRMYKEYPKGTAPPAMEELAQKIKAADAFVFVAGEYNWGPQPGLKNMTDHFLEEWFWRPAAVCSYSNGRIAGARSNVIWHGMLSEMGMIVISSTITVGQVADALDANAKPLGGGGAALEGSFPTFAADLEWWTEATINQRKVKAPPY